MPVFKCSNGKYRIGSGGCMYKTKEDADKVWKALLAQGIYAAQRISYDFDNVLTTKKGTDQALKDVEIGNTVYIISARSNKEALLVKAKQLGIPADRVFATGSNQNKVDKIRELGIDIHHDDNIKVIDELGKKGIKFTFAESYNDYPQEASNNAKRALAYADKNGWGDCGTAVGKVRANQLANKEPISRDTIARMSAFRRQQQNKNTPYGEGCGKLMWDAWGGDAGIDWAERKLKEIDGR